MINANYIDETETAYTFQMVDGSGGTNHPDGSQWTSYERLRITAGITPAPYVPPVPTYTELRVQAYPPIGDQLDALWKGGQPEADMKLIIDGVKATHPKVI